MITEYKVSKIENAREIRVQVPGSKSITNRALLLAALSDKKCILRLEIFIAARGCVNWKSSNNSRKYKELK